MDPSALIFVALAIAWAVYLIPKALEHHDTSERTRTVDRFSSAMRVLARRDAVSRKETRLVRRGETLPRPENSTEARPEVSTETSTETSTEPAPARPIDDSGILPAHTFVRRSAAARAARRRRRVALVLVLAHALVASLAVAQVCSWLYLLAPVGLLALWLYACRRMVVRERAVRRAPVRVAPPPVAEPTATDDTTDIPVVEEQLAAAPDGWAPVSTPLPTYVSKPMAPRSVRTIDLDSTGVWSSGRSAADSALAQQADAARKAPVEEKQRRSS